ncbi:MAG: lytic transglycosylase domain-containing protein [Chloroflexi bacterium]|nr:lytic transglycosylase domain-containing protein [Chloroflexota bacterium]
MNQARYVSPYVPCILLKAIAYTESTGWKQFNADYGQHGWTVINHNDSTCDIGIMQVNSATASSAVFDGRRLASEYPYNIGAGAWVLLDDWEHTGHHVGENNPQVVEDWYFAVWAYHYGTGLSWRGNPNNSKFPWPRDPWLCGQGSQDRTKWPYQELIWGCAANPPSHQGTSFWQAQPLTLPPRDSITNPPPTHIDAPQPSLVQCGPPAGRAQGLSALCPAYSKWRLRVRIGSLDIRWSYSHQHQYASCR